MKKTHLILAAIAMIILVGGEWYVWGHREVSVSVKSEGDFCDVFVKDPSDIAYDLVNLPISCDFSIKIGDSLCAKRFELSVEEEAYKAMVVDCNHMVDQELTFGENFDGKTIRTESFNIGSDVNSDGYRDLRLLNTSGASNTTFDYWIYNPVKDIFEKDPVLQNIGQAEFDKQNKTITGVINYGYNRYVKAAYKHTQDKYILESTSEFVDGRLIKETKY